MTIITGMLLKKLCEKGDSTCSLIARSIIVHKYLSTFIDKREDMLRSEQLGCDIFNERHYCSPNNSSINVCVIPRAWRPTPLLCDS